VRRPILTDRYNKIYRLATHLTVLNVFLITRRAIDQQRDPFSAIWTLNFNFVLQAHELVSLECYEAFICSVYL